MKIFIFNENSLCGGLDSFIINLINHWPNGDDEIFLYCNASHPGLDVIRTSVKRKCGFVGYTEPTYLDLRQRTKDSLLLEILRKLFSPLLRYSFFLFYLKRVTMLFRKEDADRLIVVNGGHPASDMCRAAVIAWGRTKGTEKQLALYNIHNLATPVRWFEKWPEKVIDNLVIRYSSAIIGVSRSCAESLRDRFGDEGMKKVSFVYNGIPAPPLNSSTKNLRDEFGISTNSLLCSMLATYEPRKGHAFLLNVFQRVIQEVHNVYLLICGFGSPEEIRKVRDLVNDFGLSNRIFLQGFRRDADFVIKQSDLVLVPSQSFESFGLTCVEAMSNKVPVVATRVGGLPEVLEEGKGGSCFAPDDVEGYSNYIVKLLKDPELRKVLGERGFQRYNQMFQAGRMSIDYAALLGALNK